MFMTNLQYFYVWLTDINLLLHFPYLADAFLLDKLNGSNKAIKLVGRLVCTDLLFGALD